MKILEVRELEKSFGGNKVLKGVSFYLEEGKVLGVVGPNGSGKTTLLNVIAGVIRQDRGAVFYYEKNISSLKTSSRAKLGIGRTFQITRLFTNLSVYENVLISLKYGSGEEATKEEIENLVNMVGLSHKLHEKAGSLSLAQRKRLELARALALKPKLLLLDEVFAGLNPVSIREIVKLLERIRNESSISLLLVEHVLKALFQLTDRVVVLAEGEIIFEGTPDDMVKDERVMKAYLGEVKEDEIT